MRTPALTALRVDELKMGKGDRMAGNLEMSEHLTEDLLTHTLMIPGKTCLK